MEKEEIETSHPKNGDFMRYYNRLVDALGSLYIVIIGAENIESAKAMKDSVFLELEEYHEKIQFGFDMMEEEKNKNNELLSIKNPCVDLIGTAEEIAKIMPDFIKILEKIKCQLELDEQDKNFKEKCKNGERRNDNE